MDRLTKEEIVAAWNSAVPESKDKGIEMYLHLMQAVADAQYRKCSLSLESVRSEADVGLFAAGRMLGLEQAAEVLDAEIADEWVVPDARAYVKSLATRIRALSPARVAEGVTVRHDWQPLADEPETYLCRNCGCWTANLPLYEDEICEAKERER